MPFIMSPPGPLGLRAMAAACGAAAAAMLSLFCCANARRRLCVYTRRVYGYCCENALALM